MIMKQAANKEKVELSIEDQEKEILKEEAVELRKRKRIRTESFNQKSRLITITESFQDEPALTAETKSDTIVNKVGSGPAFPTKTADWSLSTLSQKPNEGTFFKKLNLL